MRISRLSLALSCALVVGSGYASAPARADGESEEPDQKLLALGDSIAFGYDPTADFTNENNFKGYPEKFRQDDYGNYAVKNASCPGETTGSFISTTAPDNGCRAYRSAYPLHLDYGDSTTQLDLALKKLSKKSGEKPFTLVTLDLSANDLFLLQQSCSADPTNYQTCFSNGLPAVINGIVQNLTTIFSRIRNEAGYQGRFVFMNLYTVDYTDANAVAVVNTVNMYATQVARGFGAQIADAFGAFAAAANNGKACDAGLLIKLPNGTCDVHPSNKGDKVLADSVKGAN